MAYHARTYQYCPTSKNLHSSTLLDSEYCLEDLTRVVTYRDGWCGRIMGICTIGTHWCKWRYIYIYIYIYIYWQHFFVNTNFIKHNRHFLSTYFLLDLQCTFLIQVQRNIHAQQQNYGKILTDNTTILEQQNNKQKLQILEALHIKNIQSTLKRINFQTSANVLKCL